MEENLAPTFTDEELRLIQFAIIWDHYGRPELDVTKLLGIVAGFAKFVYDIAPPELKEPAAND